MEDASHARQPAAETMVPQGRPWTQACADRAFWWLMDLEPALGRLVHPLIVKLHQHVYGEPMERDGRYLGDPCDAAFARFHQPRDLAREFRARRLRRHLAYAALAVLVVVNLATGYAIAAGAAPACTGGTL